MQVQITSQPAPDYPGKTIYTIVGAHQPAVQLAIENLMNPPVASPGARAAHFSFPVFDSKRREWIAYGTIVREPQPA